MSYIDVLRDAIRDSNMENLERAVSQMRLDGLDPEEIFTLANGAWPLLSRADWDSRVAKCDQMARGL